MAHLESNLSQQLGREIAVSRAHIFLELFKRRFVENLESLDADRFFHKFTLQFRPDKLPNLVDGGSSSDVFRQLHSNNIFVFDAPLRKNEFVKEENRRLVEIEESFLELYKSYVRGDIRSEEFRTRFSDFISEQTKANESWLAENTGSSFQTLRNADGQWEIQREVLLDTSSSSRAQEQIKQKLASGQSLLMIMYVKRSDQFAADGQLLTSKRDIQDFFAHLLGRSGNHAVLITGARLNSRGDIEALRIRNSWGQESADGGYFWLTWKEFNTRSEQVYFYAPYSL